MWSLKTGEGLARFFRAELRKTFTANIFAKAGAFIAARALKKMGERLDPSAINGGPFLGLNGVVVKSHGGADVRGFATAIRLAADLAGVDFAGQIERDLGRLPDPAKRESATRDSPMANALTPDSAASVRATA